MRLEGLDISRALAILGMMLVNYKLVFSMKEPEWAIPILGVFEGRAAAVFMVLAGIGLGLMSRQARQSGSLALRKQIRLILVKRSIFLWVLGLILYTVFEWTADILHFYGAFMLLILPVIYWDSRKLLVLLAILAGISVTLQLTFNYAQGWNFDTLNYSDFWTPGGFTRNLFFNGFHPVFPWFGFMILGLLLSHAPLNETQFQERMIAGGLAVAISAECLSAAGLMALDHSELAVYLLDTKPMPANLLYMLASSAWAVGFIGICLTLPLRSRIATMLLNPLKSTGQMALTHYVFHSTAVLVAVSSLGLLKQQSGSFVIGLSLGVYVFMVISSSLWLKHFKRGPLELIIRRLVS